VLTCVAKLAVPCLDPNTLARFLSPSRDEAVSMRVDEHAATCRACRLLLAEAAALMPLPSVTVPLAHDDVSRASQGDGRAFITSMPSGPPLGAQLAQRVAHAQAAQRLGTVLRGKWHVDRLLGVGGMAQVFAGTHRNGHRVALKLMRPELAAVPELVERFQREGYVANKVSHPGAVSVLDDDVTADGIPFLVMQLLEGLPLSARLERLGPLGVPDALSAMEQVLDVLAAAHDHGIVHRDIKPENLFETTAGDLKVLDFGIARLRDEAGAANLTRSGVTMGTVGYMPPEQARGQTAQVDARSDVWAAGATLFTLLTGRLVHQATTANETLLLAMTAPVAPMRQLLPELPPMVAAVLDRALAFAKEARFSSGSAMRDAVHEARAAEGSRAVRAGRQGGHSAPSTLLGMACTVALADSSIPTLAPSLAPVSQASSVSSGEPRGTWRRLGAAAALAAAVLCVFVAASAVALRRGVSPVAPEQASRSALVRGENDGPRSALPEGKALDAIAAPSTPAAAPTVAAPSAASAEPTARAATKAVSTIARPAPRAAPSPPATAEPRANGADGPGERDPLLSRF